MLFLLLSTSCASTGGRGATDAAFSSAELTVPLGARVYANECASCHGDRGEGMGVVPALMGAGALPKSRHDRPLFRTASDVAQYVETQMPLPKKRAGSLSAAQYWAVTSFMLKAHGIVLPGEGLTEANAGTVPVNQ